MPINVGLYTDLLEESENSISSAPPTLPPLSFEETNHHILDLLLNESLSEIEFEASTTTPQINSFEDKNTSDNNYNNPREIANLLGLDNFMSMNSEREELNQVLLSQVKIFFF